MAYINQTDKARIAAALKNVVPAGWKYSLSINNHSTLCLKIASAPVDIIASMVAGEYFDPATATTADINGHYIRRAFANDGLADIFMAINDAMNSGNHDNSDTATDYFDVGWYTAMKIGAWNRPFVFTAAA